MQPESHNDGPGSGLGGKPLRMRALRMLGLLFFGLGSAGLFLPFMPTTIFWILAAWAFASSAPELRQRILDHPRFGTIVSDFTEHGVISRRGKLWSLIGIFGGLSLSAWVTSLSMLGLAALTLLMSPLALFLITRPEARP